jgi:uncharacterized repeat protein (TIGR01451 family)
VGRLAPDATFTFAYRATVNAAAQGDTPATLTNVACYLANSEDQPTTEFRGCAPAQVTVPPNPSVDLGVVKTVSADVVAPGETLIWTLVATNHGPGTSTGFEVRDELPPGVAFVSATATAPLTCTTPAPGASGAIVCTAPSVPAGTSLTVTITATVPATAANGTVLRNVATVNGDQPEPTPDPHANRDTALTSVITQPPVPQPAPAPPDPAGPAAPPVPPTRGGILAAHASGTRLALSKRADTTTVRAGELITYRLRVANTAEARATGVRVCDRLPHGLTLVRAPGFHRRSGLLCRNVGRLAIGGAGVLRITTRVTAAAPRRITNVATADAVNARRVIARATVGAFAHCAAAPAPVAHIAC